MWILLWLACRGPASDTLVETDGETAVEDDTDELEDTDSDDAQDTDTAGPAECESVATGTRWSGTIDLRSGCSLLGQYASDATGTNIDVGDFDGDGVLDLAVAAPDFEFPWSELNYKVGMVYLVRGPIEGNVALSSSSYMNTYGPAYCGRSIALVRDMDGDGGDELVVGGGDALSEGVWSFRHDPDVEAHYDGAYWDGAEGYYSEVDWDVADAGDVDGDGVHDFIAGAPSPIANGWSSDHVGQAYVVFGPPRADPYNIFSEADVHVAGSIGRPVGESVAGLGDVNGDGRDDFAVSDPYGSWSLFHGPGTATLADSDADATLSGFVAVAGKVDLDSDGVADVVGGAADGRVRGFRGAELTGFVDNSIAYVRIDAEAGGDDFGAELEAGDLDLDGFIDLVVGAPGADGGGVASGTVYLFYGDLVGTIQAADADARFEGDAGWRAGTGLAAGDVNGDGAIDLVIGSPFADGEEPSAGLASVLLGGGG